MHSRHFWSCLTYKNKWYNIVPNAQEKKPAGNFTFDSLNMDLMFWKIFSATGVALLKTCLNIFQIQKYNFCGLELLTEFK